MAIKYRLVNNADLPLLAEMNAHLIQDEGHRNPMDLGQLELRMKNWLDSIYQAVIFEEYGDTVGYALYRETDDGGEGQSKGIYLRQFFVAREHRRKGIGTAAFELLRSQLWGDGCRITLETLTGNKAAQAFWQKLSFREYCISYELYNPDNRK
jgi:GNAT superfamily N-acetyltransferase